MSIPDFQKTMLPALKAVSLKQITTSKEVIAEVIKHFMLTQDEIEALLPSKTQRIIDNRVNWALSYMFKAGLVIRPSKGKYSISERGKSVISANLKEINSAYLMNYSEFNQWKKIMELDKSVPHNEISIVPAVSSDPLEQIERNHQSIKASVVDELLRVIRALDPTDFEKLILELMKKIGYGADNFESILHIGKSGDGGIDGEISQDCLGLDKIFIQAKKYAEDNPIGRPAIQQFVGSLNERRAQKGIFITSSYFAQPAKEYVEKVDMKIILIDGLRLAQLMYDHSLGVETVQTFDVKRVNSDFFE